MSNANSGFKLHHLVQAVGNFSDGFVISQQRQLAPWKKVFDITQFLRCSQVWITELLIHNKAADVRGLLEGYGFVRLQKEHADS